MKKMKIFKIKTNNREGKSLMFSITGSNKKTLEFSKFEKGFKIFQDAYYVSGESPENGEPIPFEDNTSIILRSKSITNQVSKVQSYCYRRYIYLKKTTKKPILLIKSHNGSKSLDLNTMEVSISNFHPDYYEYDMNEHSIVDYVEFIVKSNQVVKIKIKTFNKKSNI